MESNSPGSRKAAYASLTAVERAAFLLTALDCQVCNGGFRQWVDNGYGQRIEDTLAAVLAIGTELSGQVATALNKLLPHINTEMEAQGCFGDYWVQQETRSRGYRASDDEDEEEEEETEGPGPGIAESLDEPYYDRHETWLREVDAWLADGAPDGSAQLREQAKPVPYVLAPSGTGIRYPQIKVRLVGEDSNAFNIMGLVRRALKEHKVCTAEQEAFASEARSGDYDRLLQTCMRWVDVG